MSGNPQLLELPATRRLVSEDEETAYLQRVEQARLRLARLQGRSLWCVPDTVAFKPSEEHHRG